jgi:hypothetical protein
VSLFVNKPPHCGGQEMVPAQIVQSLVVFSGYPVISSLTSY